MKVWAHVSRAVGWAVSSEGSEPEKKRGILQLLQNAVARKENI
jgi:hypothetical protein